MNMYTALRECLAQSSVLAVILKYVFGYLFFLYVFSLSLDVFFPGKNSFIHSFHSDLWLWAGPYAGYQTRSRAPSGPSVPQGSSGPVTTVRPFQSIPANSRHPLWIHLSLFSHLSHINLLVTNKLRHSVLHKLFLLQAIYVLLASQ